jgi:O-antigen biosynthesis protein
MKKLDLSSDSHTTSSKDKTTDSYYHKVSLKSSGLDQVESQNLLTIDPSAKENTEWVHKQFKPGGDTSIKFFDGDKQKGRLKTLFRLACLAVSHPIFSLKLINGEFMRNIFQFIMNKGMDGDHIFKKYKQIYLIPHQKNTLVNRIATTIKLAGIALVSPRVTLKLFNIKFFKNAFQFLSKNEVNGNQILNKYQKIYFNSSAHSGMELHHSVKELVFYYKLPFSKEKDSSEIIKTEDIHHWVENLQHLSHSIPHHDPTVSIIIPVHNHVRFTLACVHSIFINAGRYDFEIIIADDQSTDETSSAFQADIRCVRYIQNKRNLGFLNNCNSAAKHAKGRFLVFLNNDTIVLPGWLDELIKPLENNSSIGLTGSKLIYPDGRLQEAGGIIFADASGWNYGRLEHPGQPQFNYLRDVDYCSGASIAIPLEIWKNLKGFDTRFSPAYYEDTDLAFQIRSSGKRVVYQPLSELAHFEGISHGTSEKESVKQYQPRNKIKFLAKWNDVLSTYGTCNPASLPFERCYKGRILVIDAVTPTPDKDSGSLDTYNFLRIFKDLGYHVTFIPENLQYCGQYTRSLNRIGVQCIHLPWFTNIQSAIMHYVPLYDYVIIYRATVAASLIDVVRKHAPNARLIFDTVDLHFLREDRKAAISKSQKDIESAKSLRDLELGIIKKADATILLSTYEMELVGKLVPERKLFHLPIVRDIPGRSGVSWEDRRDIVFIGGYNHPPNIDAVQYFVNKVWPHLRANGFSGRFIIAGSDMPSSFSSLAAKDIIVRGYIPDLSDLFGKIRLSVAPLRYGAGMKGKVITSLAYGVPCIATSIAVEGTDLVPGKDIIVEDAPKEMARLIHKIYHDKSKWEKLSEAGLQYCIENCSMSIVRGKIESMLSELDES